MIFYFLQFTFIPSQFVQFYCSHLAQLFLSCLVRLFCSRQVFCLKLYSYFPHFFSKESENLPGDIPLSRFFSPLWGYTITINGNFCNVF